MVGLAMSTLPLASCVSTGAASSSITTFNAGESALNHGDCITANADFAKFLSRSPGNVTALEGEAECYSNSGLWGKAIATLKSVVKLDRSFQIYDNLANYYWHQGELGSAYAALINAANSPGHSSLNDLQNAKIANQWQGFSTSLTLLKMVPTSAWNSQAFLTAGEDEVSLGLKPQALSYFKEAIAQSVSALKGNTYFQIGNCWYNNLDYTQAVSSYEQAIKGGNVLSNSSDYEVLYLQLANAEVNIGSLSAGESDYYNALRYATSSVQKDNVKLQIGELMLRMGNITAGKKILESLTGPNIDITVRQQASSALHP